MARSPNDNSRDHMVAGMHEVLKSRDLDGDGQLSRVEVRGMIDEFSRRVAKDSARAETTANLEKQRQALLAFYASQDTNHDGYLNIDELLRAPLANFDCTDANHDGKVSREEIVSGMQRCPSVNVDDYAPKT